MSKIKDKKHNDEKRLARLERKGLIRRGTGDFGEWLKTHKPIKIPGGARVLEALLEERGSGAIHPKDIVLAWVDAFNRADSEALAAFYAGNAINHQVAEEPVKGRKAIREMFAADF